MEETLSLWSHVYRWPADIGNKFMKDAFEFCLVETALGEHFHPLHLAIFHFTIKSHYLLHIGMIARYINPRLGWCYSGEDMMGKIKHLVQHTYDGTPPHVLVNKTMKKYAYGLGFDLAANRHLR